MQQPSNKCVIILSAKSSGSSALQNHLTKHPHVRHIDRIKHYEHETLYWVKAASVLGLPQVKLAGSIVPIPADQARADLVELLTDNLGPDFTPPRNDRELVFEGWHRLCQRYAPVFVEKTPHHLYQWSALELIMEAMCRTPDIQYLLVGLVRNPMDTLYSMWQRWNVTPEDDQYEWRTVYTNLLKLKPLLGEQLVIVRYEDMISDQDCLRPVYDFIGVPQEKDSYFHSQSLSKWRHDKRFGFRLSENIIALAEQYGYARRDVTNDGYLLWPLYRAVPPKLLMWFRQARRTGRRIRKQLLTRHR